MMFYVVIFKPTIECDKWGYKTARQILIILTRGRSMLIYFNEFLQGLFWGPQCTKVTIRGGRLFSCDPYFWFINHSIIKYKSLHGFNLVNHWWFAKFVKLSFCLTFQLYSTYRINVLLCTLEVWLIWILNPQSKVLCEISHVQWNKFTLSGLLVV